MKTTLLATSLLLLFLSCSPGEKHIKDLVELHPVPLSFATGFQIDEGPDYTIVTITRPYKGAGKSLVYVFYDKTSTKPKIAADAYVATPVSSIVCTSTTHIPLLDYLGESESLIGFPTLDYVSSEKMRQRIREGKVTELGIDKSMNLERLIQLQPEMVMGYSLAGDLGQFALMEEAGIPVILNAEFLENHPLGRAEWIKLAGIIFNKRHQADSVFDSIVNQYQRTKSLIKNEGKQSVLTGIIYGDSWFLPGGDNYASTLFRDAGYSFFWSSDTSSAFLPVSFETVFNKAHDTDYWIGVASFNTIDELGSNDPRYREFSAFQHGKVYSYNKRMGEKGGSEYLELGYLRPDLILKDLVKIGHPDLLPDHELFFHFKLP